MSRTSQEIDCATIFLVATDTILCKVRSRCCALSFPILDLIVNLVRASAALSDRLVREAHGSTGGKGIGAV